MKLIRNSFNGLSKCYFITETCDFRYFKAVFEKIKTKRLVTFLKNFVTTGPGMRYIITDAFSHPCINICEVENEGEAIFCLSQKRLINQKDPIYFSYIFTFLNWIAHNFPNILHANIIEKVATSFKEISKNFEISNSK